MFRVAHKFQKCHASSKSNARRSKGKVGGGGGKNPKENPNPTEAKISRNLSAATETRIAKSIDMTSN